LQDAALVILGHGTTLNEGSARPVLEQVATLRSRQIFARVLPAFWKQEPQIKPVLDGIADRRIFIVPLMISEGYFAREMIPGELGFNLTADSSSRVLQRGSSRIYYCQPVGTHPRITDVLRARARNVVEQYPFPRAPKPKDISLFIAGHGTGRNAQSKTAIEAQVKLLQDEGEYHEVRGVYLDEDPRIKDCQLTARARNVVVIPFFVSDGLHTAEDIPVLLGESDRIVKERLAAGQPTWRNPTEQHGKLTWYAGAIGCEPILAEVILERVREVAQIT